MRPPVLILGAGINGAAIARELALNQAPVVVVDAADVACGATSASSRLIHGGLRYLEYGEFDLVRESLEERTRLLRLAPHLVRPLELFIPIANRFGGFSTAVRRMSGSMAMPSRTSRGRGLWLVRAGLRWYDIYARDPDLPRHRVYRAEDPQAVPFDTARFRWACSYFDAQVPFPERMTLALLDDARRAAGASGVRMDVHTYSQARLHGQTAEIVSADGQVRESFTPAAIVNATGAWIDGTLEQLHVSAPRLIGGTKGSHFLTQHARLRELLAGRGVYAEAADGRPVFVLPLGDQVLVGTTDTPYEGDPRDARATEEELTYLVAAVNHVFADLNLSREDIDWHYAGVRPLPYVDRRTPASITRRHWLHEHADAPLPMYSVIGGKLTTCRSLAESSARRLLERLGWSVKIASRDRPLPAEEILQLAVDGSQACLDGTQLPLAAARWSIEHEWVSTLADLVERRLMLLYHRRLTRRCIEQLAEQLADSGKLQFSQLQTACEDLIARLEQRFGKRVE